MEEESKAKRTCHAREVDMISNLPDALISQILFYLPTKEAVLSHRWKNLWLLITELDLDSTKFPVYDSFVRFVDRFLDKLTLKILKYKKDKSCLTRWVDFVARTRTLKRLDVEYHYVSRKRLEVMPVSLCVCEPLLYLRLNRVLVGSFESVSLPCLKTMRLEENTYATDTCLESLISSCPVLEDLSIVRRFDDNVRVLRVLSQTITSLNLEYDPCCDQVFFKHDWGSVALFIDAPRLEYLNLENELSPSKFISNLGSLVKVRFVGDVRITLSHNGDGLSNLQMVSKFFNDILRVRDLILSPHTMKDLCDSRILRRPIELSSVPQCLLSSLEFVEIRSSDDAEFFLMELARYFAENSAILKKLVVRWTWKHSKLEEDTVLRDLLAFSWRFSSFQIEVCGPLKRLVV